MISDQQNEKKAYQAMARAKGLNDFYDIYKGAGCDIAQYPRFHRIYEIRLINDPKELKRLARHHILQAEENRLLPWFIEFEKNLRKKCKHLRNEVPSLLGRIEPACEAIEKLGLDPNGECRASFHEILMVLNQAFDRVEDEIKHLRGRQQLEARWSRHQEILQNWRQWHLSSFFERFKSIMNYG